MEKGIDSYLRFLKGESSAMRTIVELYWDNMLWFTNQYVHNLTDAEDIAQEALVRLCTDRNCRRSISSKLICCASVGIWLTIIKKGRNSW